MKIQHHRIDANVVVGLLVREFCCSGTDVSAKVLAMYAGTRTSPMEPQWLATGLSQVHIAFRVGSRASVDTLTERLKGDGYQVVSGPRTTGDGYYESCIRGIEGNLIEITE